jgi:hypothetical protein
MLIPHDSDYSASSWDIDVKAHVIYRYAAQLHRCTRCTIIYQRMLLTTTHYTTIFHSVRPPSGICVES